MKRKARRANIYFVIFFIILTMANADTVLLSELGIFPYPKKEQLIDSLYKKEWLEVSPLASKDNSTSYDYEWLTEIARRKRVMLVGENHWYAKTHQMVEQLFFHLNKVDRYPTIFLELEYSKSAYFQYYVSIKDDLKAQKFFIAEIDKRVHTPDLLSLLNKVRIWNKSHPELQLVVLTHDIEHSWEDSLRNTVLPFCKLVDPRFELEDDEITFERVPEILKRVRKLLEDNANEHVEAPYPFLTYQYIFNVLENIEAHNKAKQGQINRVHYTKVRQKAIIKNLTNFKFHGRFINKGKFVLYGGNYHTPSRLCLGKGKNYLREGSYFSCEYPQTKGKTYSICIDGFSYSLDKMAGADRKQYQHNASMYWGVVEKFNKALEHKLVFPDKYYFFWSYASKEPLAPFYMNSYQFEHVPLRVTNINWTEILGVTKKFYPEYINSLTNFKKRVSEYFDTFIFHTRSKLQRTRKR